MRVLIWCPMVNPGGGDRLLARLVPAMTRQPGMDLVRLAVPAEVPAEKFTAGLTESEQSRLEVRFIAPKHGPQRPQGLAEGWLWNEKRTLGIPGTARLKRVARQRLASPPSPEVTVAEWEQEQLRSLSQDVDLVYVFWPHRQDFLAVDKPVVCTFQDATLLDYPELMGVAETLIERARSAVWLKNSAQVIVSSDATRKNLIRLFGKQCASSVVVHHAILPAVVGQRSTKADSPVLQRLPKQYVVFPANLSAHKNHYNLLSAWARFTRRRDIPLVCFGNWTDLLNRSYTELDDYWQWTRLASLIERKGLEHEQDFFALGYIHDEDVLALVNHASALVMPTLAEGGGSYPVEEALSLGVPVLCSDIPVLREHVKDRTARIGWFDPESPESIIRALNDLFDNYAAYKQSAMDAMDDPRPSWDDVAAEYAAVFRTVLNRPQKQADCATAPRDELAVASSA